MPDNIWDLDTDAVEADTEGFKSLRTALRKAQSELKARDKSISDLTSKYETATKALSAKSVDDLTSALPANVKKFLIKDFNREGTEPTKEAVDAWLAENAADFGYDPSKASEQSTQNATQNANDGGQQPDLSGLDPETAAAIRATQGLNTGQGTGNVPSGQLEETIRDLGTQNLSTADLIAKFRDLGAPVSSYGQ